MTRPLFAEIADLFGSFGNDLGKRMYTRFWGKFGSRGGYVGHRNDNSVCPGEVPASGLWWKYDGIELESHKAPAIYRPDLSAFIAAANHRRVIEATRQLAPGSVVACHVDAIWTTDIVGAVNVCSQNSGLGGWRQKRTGDLRFYGVGCYRHDKHLAASGYDAKKNGKLTQEKIEDWISSGTNIRRRMLMETREWDGDPAVDANAKSRPLRLDMDTTTSPAEGSSVYDGCWTLGGWLRKHEIDPNEPLSTVPPPHIEAVP